MKAFDIMEALTDVDDTALLRAEQDPPRHRAAFSGILRYATAACLVIVMIFSVMIVNKANAGTNQICWTRHVREGEFYYTFWNAERPDTPMPTYRTTWFPEGYVTWVEEESELGYNKGLHLSEDDSIGIWFRYSYVGNGDSHYYNYDQGSYTYTATTVNGLPADLYRLENSNSGILIWFDREESLVFTLRYDCDDDTAMRIAEGVILMEGK